MTTKPIELIFVSSKRDTFGTERLHFKIDPIFQKSSEYKEFLNSRVSKLDTFWETETETKMMSPRKTDFKFIKGKTYIIDLDITEHYDHRYHNHIHYEAHIKNSNEKDDKNEVDFID